MSSIPSPILLFGDLYVSKNNILAAKRKYPNLVWVIKSATKDSLNDIRAVVGTSSWDDSEKVVLIQELPNRKNVREFLLDLAKNCPAKNKLIIWDSNNEIGVDHKTQTIEKTWAEFVSGINQIQGAKVINNGDQLTEKDSIDSVNIVIKKFENEGKVIEPRDAKLMLSIVGYDRGMIESEIKKMCLTAPDHITPQFILDNAFPTSKESLFYKMANAMDSGSYESCIDMVERFLSGGTNHNFIAEIVVKKARWQLAATHLWYSGLDWSNISGKLMEMGKFPSAIWHDFQIGSSEKKVQSETYQGPKGILGYLSENQGIPERIFKIKIEEEKEPKEPKKSKDGKTAKVKTTRKGAEVIPMSFMADQTVDFVKNRIVNANREIPLDDLKERVLNRAIKVYIFVQNKLSEIRYGENPDQDLQEMLAAIVNTRII